MASGIARRIISKPTITSTRFLASSYLFVKPPAIDNYHSHPSLISSSWGFPTTTTNTAIVSLLLLRPFTSAATTTNNQVASSSSSPPPPSSSFTIRSFRSQNPDYMDQTPLVGPLIPEYDPGLWLCYLTTQGVEFTSGKDLLACYINTLASVVGSVGEAKKKIYLASWDWYCCCFGAEIDEQTKTKLEGLSNVRAVLQDHYAHVRDKSPIAQSPTEVTPLNWNNRLLNMDDYHKSSECKKQGDSRHWLIKLKRPDGGFSLTKEAIEWCIQFLAEFVGREEAKTRIYIIWCGESFGFGAEIDEGVLKQLEAQPNVRLLEDHAFDVQRKDLGVLVCRHANGNPAVVYWSMDDMLNSDDEDSDSDSDIS